MQYIPIKIKAMIENTSYQMDSISLTEVLAWSQKYLTSIIFYFKVLRRMTLFASKWRKTVFPIKQELENLSSFEIK